MLISEELFLLLRRDDGKAESSMSMNGYGLAAAVVSDLILAERLGLDDRKDPRVSVTSARPTGEPVLDAALQRLTDKDGRRLSSCVTDSRLNLEELIADGLARAGVIRIEEKRALGLVPARYPVVDPRPEQTLRARLARVLAGGAPIAADGIVLSILQGLDLAAKVLETERGALSKKDLKQRIQVVSAEAPAGKAVAGAVSAMNAALMTAVMVPVITTAGSN